MLKTVTKNLNSSQLSTLQKFGDMVVKFGVNFAVCGMEGEFALFCRSNNMESSAERLMSSSLAALEAAGEKNKHGGENDACYFDRANNVLAFVLRTADEAAGTALIDLGIDSGQYEGNGSRDTLDNDAKAEYLRGMLGLLAEHFLEISRAQEQTEMVSYELSQTYEELVLLHKLSTNMKVTETDSNYLQMACDSLTDIVSVEGIAMLLEKTVDEEKKQVIAAGSGLIDINEQMAVVLHSRLEEQISSGKEALLDSDVDSPLKYDWPENIKNIIAVPLYGAGSPHSDIGRTGENSQYLLGLMVAVNRIDKPDFDSPDVKLFNSVANRCAVFIENCRLFKDLKELFIGSLKALTSSIDAKDPYTRGHSERVAFISRWIAERLAEKGLLEDKQIHKIYLSGLLHDIGKMGISETVLRKNGKLTDEEYDHIKTHPTVGAGILSGIKQMREIVPAVLCHHERMDGRGYPNGMTEENIPLIGKIVGLADSFDAMTSKRVYRDALTVEQTLAEIEKCIGSQFDEEVARVFLDSDIYSLWEIIQNGLGEINTGADFSEYGTAAVGTLIE
jgi:HD-GYP domain-containing protein (c-di-GMP phosphodiesterase class II)